MFRLGRPSAAVLASVASGAQDLDVTYEEVGASLSGTLPAGYRHDRCERRLGEGPRTFVRASEGLRVWAAHREAGQLIAPDSPPAVGVTVALGARVGPLTAIAPCRVVALVEEGHQFGFAYGTLPGHPEQGEEAFLVEARPDGVVFVITAFSRPAEVLARIGGPLTRRVQRWTVIRYLDGLERFVSTP